MLVILRNFLVITGQEFPQALLALHATAKLVARILLLPPVILAQSTVMDLFWSENPQSKASPGLEIALWPSLTLTQSQV